MDLLLAERINELEGELKKLALRIEKLEKKKAKAKIDVSRWISLINECHNLRYGCTLTFSPMMIKTVKMLLTKCPNELELETIIRYYYEMVDDYFIIQKAHDIMYLYTNFQKYVTEAKTGVVIDAKSNRQKEIQRALHKL